MNVELSRTDVATLLEGFLTGTQAVELRVRLTDLADLPSACRTLVKRAESAGLAWTAWMTDGGPMAAWGDVDAQGSREINACVVFVEWWTTTTGHHSLWCHCDPKRPTEWTVGRTRP
jgi:hypothetical protein